jgi:hypothetical protein
MLLIAMNLLLIRARQIALCLTMLQIDVESVPLSLYGCGLGCHHGDQGKSRIDSFSDGETISSHLFCQQDDLVLRARPLRAYRCFQ